jgi:para-aminobenzoate synthetase/4-amino-4-deoxychorismate lyase
MDKIKPQIEPIQKHEALLKNGREWLHFARPYRWITTENLNEVVPALQEVEQLVEGKGWYAAGFLSYEAASAFDPSLETRGLLSKGLSVPTFPHLGFGLYPEPTSIRLPRPDSPKAILDWQPTTERGDYQSAITTIKNYIAAGRTYQVNYTMRLRADFSGSAWQFFLHLVQQQNRHAAYIDTGRYVICSASPELFFQLDGNTITCQPMKGTTSRGRTTAEDHEQADWLRRSLKNRAENVMIVDMIRNDLGRIAEIGSVSVPRLFEADLYGGHRLSVPPSTCKIQCRDSYGADRSGSPKRRIRRRRRDRLGLDGHG